MKYQIECVDSFHYRIGPILTIHVMDPADQSQILRSFCFENYDEDRIEDLICFSLNSCEEFALVGRDEFQVNFSGDHGRIQ